MKKRRLGIRHKTMAFMALLTIIPVLSMGIISLRFSRGIILNRMNQLASKNLETVERQVKWKFDMISSVLQQIPQDQVFTAIVENPGALPSAYCQRVAATLRKSRYLGSLGIPTRFVLAFEEDLFATTTYSPSRGVDSIRERLEVLPWFQALKARRYPDSWMGIQENIENPYGGAQLYFARNMMMDGVNQGVAVLGVNASYMRRMLESFQLTENSRLALVRQGSGSIITGDGEVDATALPTGDGTWTLDGKESLVMVRAIEVQDMGSPWLLYSITPTSDMYAETSRLTKLIVSMMLLSCALIAMMIIGMNRWLVRPVLDLSSGMNALRNGDMTVRVRTRRRDEIGELCDGFNETVRALDESMEHIRQDEEKKRRLETRMLQSQINPHFIRNAMNTVRWMADLKGATGISRYLTAFSSLIDYCFTGEDVRVALGDELQYLEKYIYIQQIRYQNLFEYRADVPPELMNAMIPRLLLQPIVENSVLHGVTAKATPGSIVVIAEREGGDILIRVWDDGIGMDAERVEQIMDGSEVRSGRGGTHIGIHNVHERLRLNYGDAYGLDIQSESGRYTQVTLRLPYEEGKNDDESRTD